MRLRTTVPALALSALFAILSGCSGGSGNSSTTTTTSTQPITVAIGLTSSSIEAGSSLPLTAGVSNDASLSGVTWTLTSGPGSIGNTSTFGATYFAPTTLTAATMASVTATSVKDTTKSYTATFAVTPGVNFAAQTLPVAYVGTPYSANIAASGGTGTLRYTLSSGTLPTGLTLSPTGSLSGTPTAAYSGSFTVQVTDNASPASTATATIALKIISNISISNAAALPSGTVGQAYNYSLTAANASGTVTWSITSGTLPAGLTLSTTTGVISGTPTAPTTGTSVSITATDTSGGSATAVLNFVIATSPTITNAALLPAAVLNKNYGFTLTATGTSGTATWSIISGTLPTGLTFSSGGTISGVPTSTGSTITVQVADTTGGKATATVKITVNPSALAFSPIQLPNGVVGALYKAGVFYSGASGAVTVTWSNLPPGVTNATYILSGYPTTAGTYNVGVQMSDAAGTTINTTIPVTIGATALPPGPANNILNGSYAVLLQGQSYGTFTAGQGNPPTNILGSLKFDGISTVSGVLDISSGAQTETTLVHATVTGSYAVTADHRGIVILTTSSYTPATPIVLFLAANSISTNTGIAAGFQVEKGDYDPAAGRYNSVLAVGAGRLQSLPSATSFPSGDFVLGTSGRYSNANLAMATAGILHADGAGNLTGTLDLSSGVTYSVSGTYTAPGLADGRGIFNLNSTGANFVLYQPLSYIYYAISPSEWLVMSATYVNAPVNILASQAGATHLQSGPFTNASLSGSSVGYEASAILATSCCTSPMGAMIGKILTVSANSAGVAAIDAFAVSGSGIGNNFGSPESDTYSVAANGRVTWGTSSKITGVVYLYDTNKGFGVETNGYSSIPFNGLVKLEPQVLNTSNFPGIFSSGQLPDPNQLSSNVGIFNFISPGILNSTDDSFTPGYPYSGTFTAGTDGTLTFSTIKGVQITDSRAIVIDTTNGSLNLLQK